MRARPTASPWLLLMAVGLLLWWVAPALLARSPVEILRLVVPVLLLAAGQGLVLMGGRVDAAGGTLAVAIALAWGTLGPAAGLGLGGQAGALVALLVALVVGVGIALLKAVVVQAAAVPSLVAGLALAAALQAALAVLDPGAAAMAAADVGTAAAGAADVGTAAAGAADLWAAGLVLLAILGLQAAGFGRHLRAVGAAPEAVWLAGGRSAGVRLCAFGLSGLAAAAAGLVMAATPVPLPVTLRAATGAGALPAGLALSALALAAAALGGARPDGGAGGPAGAMAGALVLLALILVLETLGLPAVVGAALPALVLLVWAGRRRVTP